MPAEALHAGGTATQREVCGCTTEVLAGGDPGFLALVQALHTSGVEILDIYTQPL